MLRGRNQEQWLRASQSCHASVPLFQPANTSRERSSLPFSMLQHFLLLWEKIVVALKQSLIQLTCRSDNGHKSKEFESTSASCRNLFHFSCSSRRMSKTLNVQEEKNHWSILHYCRLWPSSVRFCSCHRISESSNAREVVPEAHGWCWCRSD